MLRRAKALGLLVSVLLAPWAARADELDVCDGHRPGETWTTVENGRTVGHTCIDVHGERQHPQSFDVTQRAPLGYTPDERSPRFTGGILDALRRRPF